MATNTQRHSSRPDAAFTLIELLLVMAIIAVVAGLIVGLAPAASDKKVRTRVDILLKELALAIDGYKEDRGYYPPDYPGPEQKYNRPPLYYCLKGTVRSAGNDQFEPLEGKPLVAAKVKSAFGLEGFLNAAVSRDQVKDYYRNLKPSHVGEDDDGVRYIVAPYKGPEGEFNPVHYDASSTNRHNLDSYDLWVDVVIGGKTVTLGNWRQ